VARALVAALVGGAALGGAAAPVAGVTDPTGDTITSERFPAPASLRPFADIVEADATLAGSTVQVRVRVVGDGPPPGPFRVAFSFGGGIHGYPTVGLHIERHGTRTTYAVVPWRSQSVTCRGVASFDGASTYTARVDAKCIGGGSTSAGVTTYVGQDPPSSEWSDQVFGVDVVGTPLQLEPEPRWTAAGATYAGTSRLRAGAALRPGQYLLADDAGTVLVLQHDGDLMLVGRGGRPRWSAGTGGQGVVVARMQSDGNLVLYRPDGRAVWSSATFGHPGARLSVQRDGNAVIYGAGAEALWSTGTSSPVDLVPVGSDRLAAGDRLRTGEYLRSADGRYVLVLRHDGDLVVYGPGHHALWTSGTRGLPVHQAVLQDDGNLVVYRTDGWPAWSSGTAGQPGRRLVVQADGNAVLYGPASRPLWWSGTHGLL
jgi:hypothetical protein